MGLGIVEISSIIICLLCLLVTFLVWRILAFLGKLVAAAVVLLAILWLLAAIGDRAVPLKAIMAESFSL